MQLAAKIGRRSGCAILFLEIKLILVQAMAFEEVSICVLYVFGLDKVLLLAYVLAACRTLALSKD
jgi:hypothetical protein